MTEEKSSDIRDVRVGEIADWAQVFGVAFAVVVAFVLASSTTAKIATALAIAVTALIVIIIRQAIKPQRWSHMRLVLIGIQMAAVVALIVVAAVVNPAEATRGTSEPTISATEPTSDHSQSAPQEEPEVEPTSPTKTRPDQSANGYVLRDSDFIDTNDQDKIDLDTACPGWGNQHPHVGPSRCGELADLILDPEGLHNANERPSLLLLPPGTDATQQICRTTLHNPHEHMVSQVEVDQLGPDIHLCAQTDQNAVAAVRIDAVDFDAVPAELTLSYELWKK
jgi:hypothetical protein